MKTTSWAFIAPISFISLSCFANPASTEYVQNQLANLKAELQTTIHLTQTRIDALPIITHSIGESYLGGIVFYVDATKQHGFVVSQNDLGVFEWRNGEAGDRVTNARGIGIGAGETNSRLIVSEQTMDDQQGIFAAKTANDYSIRQDGSLCTHQPISQNPCISGWFLPSLEELELIFHNLSPLGLGHFQQAQYWSSTEGSALKAWSWDMSNHQAVSNYKDAQLGVLAIHRF